MFTGYTFCIPIPNKMAKTVLKAYMDNVYCQFGGSIKILSDNGTEFKNKLMEEVSEELGVEYKTYSPPYRPQSNDRIVISLLLKGLHGQAHSPTVRMG